MSVRRKSARGTLVLTLGEAVIYGCSFVRNMILARVLTKEDFGISAAFSLIITLLEFSSKLGISRFVIRDEEGDEPEFLAAAHLVQGGVAVLSSLMMMSAAWPLAHLFGIPTHVDAMFILAAIPLLNGVTHLDVKRFERNLRFGPSTLVELLPQVAITVAAWPVTYWLPDYRAVVVLLVAKAALSCLCSHALAVQPYRWKLHRDYVWRMLRFGWPLLVTGFLMFGVLQGDQFLVATSYSMAELGPYAGAAALTMAPTFFFGRVFNSIALPIMAGVQSDPSSFERRYGLVIALICVFSATYSVGMIVGAEAIMQLAYGAKYAGSGNLLGWLVAANSFRNIRIAPAIAAMARGDSMNQMTSNIARVMALLPATVVALTGQPLWSVACTGLFGEALACAVSFNRLTKRHGVPLPLNAVPTLIVATAVLAAGVVSQLASALPGVASIGLAAILAAVSGGSVLILLQDARREALRLWGDVRSLEWRAALLRRAD